MDLLPVEPWFDPPYDEMVTVAICKKSGSRSLAYCPTDTAWVPEAGLKAAACDYHRLIHLDSSEDWQVHLGCESAENLVSRPWFVLPPAASFYYRAKHPDHQPPPPYRSDCRRVGLAGEDLMQFIYPKYSTRIYVPVDLDGQVSRTVFSAAHRDSDITVYWHLDATYMGSTKTFHQLEMNPSPGKHTITLVDEHGASIQQSFEIIAK